MVANSSRAALLKKLRDDPGCGELPVPADSVEGAWIAWRTSKSPASLSALRAAIDAELGVAQAKPATKPAAKKKAKKKSRR